MAGKKKDKGQNSRKSPDLTRPAQGKGAPLDAAGLLAKLESRIKVMYGANDETFDGLVGQKVADVRHALTEAFGIPVDAVPLVNEELVDGEYTLKTNDVLEFIRAAGVNPTGDKSHGDSG